MTGFERKDLKTDELAAIALIKRMSSSITYGNKIYEVKIGGELQQSAREAFKKLGASVQHISEESFQAHDICDDCVKNKLKAGGISFKEFGCVGQNCKA